jgi:putative membrane protein
MLPLVLAMLHHLLVFALVAIVASELVLVRPGMNPEAVRRVGGIDLWYGVVAGLVVVVGIARLNWGGKGLGFYQANPWFWAKMAAFAGVGLLSIPPTVAYFRWRRRLKEERGLPAPGEVAAVRKFLMVECALLASVPLFAAAMARWQG